MSLAAVAAVVVLHVTTQPPAAVAIRAEVTCDGAVAGVVSGVAGEDLRLPLQCAETAVKVEADDFVPRQLSITPADGRVEALLQRYAHLVPGVVSRVQEGRPAVWWRSSGGVPRRIDLMDKESLRMVPGPGCVAVLSGDMTPVLRPLMLEPGTKLALPKPSEKPGFYLRGVVVAGDGNAVTARVVARPYSGKTAREQHPKDAPSLACRALADELGLTSALTGNSGAFRLGPLGGAAWTLAVSAEGYAPRNVEAVAKKGSADVDVGEIRLKAIGSLRITLDTKGCPEDPPYRVRIERQTDRWVAQRNRWRQEASVMNGGDQPIVREGMAPGSYRIRVDKPGSRLSAVEFAELVAGVEQGVVVHLQPFRVSGVVTRDDSPVAGAEVRFLYEGASVDVEANEDGRYDVALWTPADYAVLTSAPGEPSPFPEHLDLTDAGPGDERTLDIELPSRTLAGVVVEKASGEPIAGANVDLSESGTSTGITRSQSQLTGDDGSFRFTNLMEGPPATVSASAEGYLPATITVDPASPEANHLVLELEESETKHGRISDEMGSPVAGAQVMCCPLGAHGVFSSATTTDGKGEFSLDAREGVLVWAVARGYTWGRARLSAGGNNVIVLRALRNVGSLELRTKAGDPVGGIRPVFSAPDGTLIPPRLVEVAGFLNGLNVVTDPHGVFMLSAFPPGTYEVWLQGTGGLRPLGVVPIPSGSSVVLTVPNP